MQIRVEVSIAVAKAGAWESVFLGDTRVLEAMRVPTAFLAWMWPTAGVELVSTPLSRYV
jgi:hypothetical protein